MIIKNETVISILNVYPFSDIFIMIRINTCLSTSTCTCNQTCAIG